MKEPGLIYSLTPSLKNGNHSLFQKGQRFGAVNQSADLLTF
jgi:hypothetical protein